VLEGLDGALVLAHGLGRLGHRESLQEPEHDALLLLGPELLDGRYKRDVRDVVHHRDPRAAFRSAALAVGVQYVAGRDLQPVPAGFEVVGDQVARC
jgi:hypothetical protein